MMPSRNSLRHGQFNEELVKAGIMLAGDGLRPSAPAQRIKFCRQSAHGRDGPFGGNEGDHRRVLVWQVRSMDEAVEWARRCPDPSRMRKGSSRSVPLRGRGLRRGVPPELRARDERLREEIERNRSSSDASHAAAVLLLRSRVWVFQSPSDWNTQPRRARIFGNSTTCGTAGLSAILITSDAGHILIDGALSQSPPLIEANIRTLKFEIRVTCAPVNSHEHF